MEYSILCDMKYGNHTPWQKILESPITIILLLILIFFLAKAVWNIHRKDSFSAAKLDQANAELAQLEASQADLSKKVAYLSTDQGVDAEIRSKYLAVQRGESVAVIVGDASTTLASTTPAGSQSGWFDRLLQFLGL